MRNLNAQEIMDYYCKQDVFNKEDYTFSEYAEELKKFERATVKLIMNDEEVENARLYDALSRFKMVARQKDLCRNEKVIEGGKALDRVNKFLSVTMAGKSAEDRVARALDYVTRQDVDLFRNVYVTDGEKETELDEVIITKNGIIIIEIKNAKEDITIAPDGRILFNNSTCYHDISIGEKMGTKRSLMKKHLEDEFRKRGIEKPAFIDSMVVFSTPKDSGVKIHDLYKKENYCFREYLSRMIDRFGSHTEYSEAEMDIIKSILQEMETNRKGFTPDCDMDEAKMAIAEAIEILSCEQTKEEKAVIRSKKTALDPRVLIKAGYIAASIAVFAPLALGLVGGLFNKKL